MLYAGMSNSAGGVRSRLKQFIRGIEKHGSHSGAMRFYREHCGGKPFAQLKTRKRLYVVALTIECEGDKVDAMPNDLRLTAGWTKRIDHRPKFHLRLFFRRRHLAEGIGSPHRAQSTSMYQLPDMGKSPGLAHSLYAGRDCGATAPSAVRSRSVPRMGLQYPQLALENILDFEPNHLQT